MTAYFIDHFRVVLVLLVRTGIWLVIAAAIFVPLERLSALHPQKVFRKEIGVDIGYYFLNSLAVAFALAGPLSIVAMVVRHAIPSARSRRPRRGRFGCAPARPWWRARSATIGGIA